MQWDVARGLSGLRLDNAAEGGGLRASQVKRCQTLEMERNDRVGAEVESGRLTLSAAAIADLAFAARGDDQRHGDGPHARGGDVGTPTLPNLLSVMPPIHGTRRGTYLRTCQEALARPIRT